MHAAILARATVERVEDALQAAAALAERHHVTIQLIDPAVVYNTRHLDSAVLHAQRAFTQGTASARTLGAEVLLYLVGKRRVAEALASAGIRPGLERVVVLGVGERAGTAIWGLLDRLGWSRDPAGLGVNPAALERIGVARPGTDPEAAVLERVALLDVRK